MRNVSGTFSDVRVGIGGTFTKWVSTVYTEREGMEICKGVCKGKGIIRNRGEGVEVDILYDKKFLDQ